MPKEILQVNPTTFKTVFNEYSEVEIGNIEKADFEPHIKLKKWGDECFIKVSLPTAKKIVPLKEGGKIKWKDIDREIHFYPLEPREFVESGRIVKQLEQGGFEYQIVEKTKPISNIITLDLELENVKKDYQPPLTEEYQNGWSEEFQREIIVTETTVKDLNGELLVHRPENMVGAYVFYHATKGQIHPTGEAEKYKTSRIGTLYRPKIIDSVGNWVWGSQEIRDGKLIITRPQSFLDNATYPIKHSAGTNFGYETKGGTEHNISASGALIGSKYTSGVQAGIADSLTVYIKARAVGANTKYAVYADDNGYPDALEGYTDEGSYLSSQDGWKTLDSALGNEASISASTPYHLMWWGSQGVFLYRDSGAANQTTWKYVTYNGFPNPYPAGGTQYAYKYSIYCTYTPAAPTPVKIEKSLKYCVIKEQAPITKSLKYTVVKEHAAIEKSLKYDIAICDKRGFVYDDESHGDPGNVAPGSSDYEHYVEDTGNFAAGAFDKTLTSLVKGTTYYVRAYAHNSDGYGYGGEVSFTAKTDVKLTKSLKYCVITTPSAKTKGLIYKVIPAIAIQKSLKYAVVTTPSALTKSLKYVVNPPPPQEISSGKVVVASDTTTATAPEDIDGLNFNITLKNEGYIMAFMTLTANIGLSDKKKGYFLININGVDSPVMIRYNFKEKDGNVEVVFRSALLPAGQYVVKGGHYTEAGVTLTSKNVTLVAFPTEDEGGNRIKSAYDTIASDSVVGSTVEDIDGLTQDITTEFLSFIFGMITGSVSSSVKDKLYRLILSINGHEMEVDRFLDSVDDVASIGLACRTQLPETAGTITIKGRHAIEEGVTGTIAPAILVALDLSTRSGGTGYVIPSGAICIEGAELSTTSVVLEDMPTVEAEVTLTQTAHIFAVLTFEMESEKSDADNFFAIRIGTVDFEEHGRTSNVKLDKAVITIVARTTTKLAAGTYSIKGRWRTTAGNTLRAINDLSLVAIGLETTTQDLPTHFLRSLDYKVVSPKSKTKDLKYTILTTPTKKTKGLIYKVVKANDITKGLTYLVVPPTKITKSLKYCVLTIPTAKTKDLKYNIFLGATNIQKSLQYAVLTIPSAITKGLEYRVLTEAKIEKSLAYKVLSETKITKSLEYVIYSEAVKIEKSLQYAVVITPAATTKSLHYEIKVELAITKSLKYCIINQPSAIISKIVKYGIVKGYPYTPPFDPYEKLENPYDAKGSPYVPF